MGLALPCLILTGNLSCGTLPDLLQDNYFDGLLDALSSPSQTDRLVRVSQGWTTRNFLASSLSLQLANPVCNFLFLKKNCCQ
jgi:hypothetical protein